MDRREALAYRAQLRCEWRIERHGMVTMQQLAQVAVDARVQVGIRSSCAAKRHVGSYQVVAQQQRGQRIGESLIEGSEIVERGGRLKKVCSIPAVSSATAGEQARTQSQLLALGVRIHINSAVEAFDGGAVTLACIYSGRRRQQSASTLVLVTSREPYDRLFTSSRARARRPAHRFASGGSAIAASRRSSPTQCSRATRPRENWMIRSHRLPAATAA
jgi:hypothetical protein